MHTENENFILLPSYSLGFAMTMSLNCFGSIIVNRCCGLFHVHGRDVHDPCTDFDTLISCSAKRSDATWLQ